MKKTNYERISEEKEKEAFKMISNMAESFERDLTEIAEFISFSAKFYTYSPRNTMLILSQNPGATFVDSYMGWKRREAYVKKGQFGIKLLVPTPITYVKMDNDWVPISQVPGEERELARNGKMETKQKLFFKIGTVFDISQTSFPKEEYPSIFHMGYSSLQHEKICQGIIDFAQEVLGCQVKKTDLSSISLRGQYVKSTEPSIQINDKLESTQKLSTFTHELGHAILHKESVSSSTAQKEFEADAFSIMLCANYGVELTYVRKVHLAENTAAFKAEVLKNISKEENMKEVWNKALFKSFDNVYSMFRENIEEIEKRVERYLPPKDLMEKKIEKEEQLQLQTIGIELEENVPKM